MTERTQHHLSKVVLSQYAQGKLDQPTSLLVACHLSFCDQCRSEIETLDILSGEIMAQESEIPPSAALEGKLMESLVDLPKMTPPRSFGCYPAPLAEELHYKEPNWQKLGPGIRQYIISKQPTSSARLLWIDQGRPVPEHGHNGLEFTLVLDGAFCDEMGEFRKGDVEVADHELEHQPVATNDGPCICLAVTTDKLKFKSLLPRLLQPIFSI